MESSKLVIEKDLRKNSDRIQKRRNIKKNEIDQMISKERLLEIRKKCSESESHLHPRLYDYMLHSTQGNTCIYKNFHYFSNCFSDILIASPLGLRKIIGSEENSKKEYDFLSSIEVMVIENADSILMQNWMFMNHVAQHINLQVGSKLILGL